MDHVEESTRLAEQAAELLRNQANPNPLVVTQLALTHAMLGMLHMELQDREEHDARMAAGDRRRAALTGLPSVTDQD